jgi:hypothetical protein
MLARMHIPYFYGAHPLHQSEREKKKRERELFLVLKRMTVAKN